MSGKVNSHTATQLISRSKSISARRYLATDALLAYEARRDLFDPVTPTEYREIASRYQLDVTLGVAQAQMWAAKWRAGRRNAGETMSNKC
jgi:hypothetical protein